MKMIKILPALVAGMTLAGAVQANEEPGNGADLMVTLEKVKSTDGIIFLQLCQGGSFDDCDNRQITPEEGTTSTVFEGLAPGTYAIQVYHDENGNGDIDMGLFGPKEPWGYSNNPRPRMGPNTFEDAAFKMGTEDLGITIRLR